MIKDNLNNLEIKYVDQRHNGVEGWIRYNNSVWIRLDFILEYYLFLNVDLTRQFKSQLEDRNKVEQYCELLYVKFSEKTLNGSEFDFDEFTVWKKNNRSEINKARSLLMK